MSDLSGYLRAGSLADLEKQGVLVVTGEHHPIAVFLVDGQPRAVDNRCPHLGFPLHRGTVQDGLLVCHWHHARFDLASGCTLDPWADDAPHHRARVVNGVVWVEGRPSHHPTAAQAADRLGRGLARNLRLVLAKSAITLDHAGADYRVPLRAAAVFGAAARAGGWYPGLSILTMAANLLPHLEEDDRPRALYHGLVAVAAGAEGQAPRRPLPPLDGRDPSAERLGRWLNQAVELRDRDGAERVLATIAATLAAEPAAGLVFAAATGHPYLDVGHALDFCVKAFELLDHVGWAEHAGAILPSLAGPLTAAERMEESVAWRSPVDLIARLEVVAADLPSGRPAGRPGPGPWMGPLALSEILLGDDPDASLAALTRSLEEGATATELAETVAYAAALRIARFPLSNEHGDWDTALHTFTYASAVLRAIERAPSAALILALFAGAMSIYVDRFLNLPAVALPRPGSLAPADAHRLLHDLGHATDRQQQVDPAASLTAAYLGSGADPVPLRRTLGAMLLREDAHFHTFQAVEAGLDLDQRLGRGSPAAAHVLVAVARYLAAHAPTLRVLGQTYQAALRLARGEALHRATDGEAGEDRAI